MILHNQNYMPNFYNEINLKVIYDMINNLCA